MAVHAEAVPYAVTAKGKVRQVRSWVTTSIDCLKRVAYLEPTEQIGSSRWLGPGQPLSFRHCQAIKKVPITDAHSDHYSRRDADEMSSVLEEFAFLTEDATTVVITQSEGRTYWWTFAGLCANALYQMRCEAYLVKFSACLPVSLAESMLSIRNFKPGYDQRVKGNLRS